MKAISIRQPWAWLILNAGKDVENRTWHTTFRGRVLIHASKGMTNSEYYDALDSLASIVTGEDIPPIPPRLEDMQRGGIVGEVEIVDCVSQSDSPWFCGPYGFVLINPKPVPFLPCKGSLGFFDLDYDQSAMMEPTTTEKE